MTTPTDTRVLEGLKLLVTFLKAASMGALLFLMLSQPENALPAYLLSAGLFLVAFVADAVHAWRVAREVRRGWELLEAGMPEQALHGLEVGVAQARSPARRARSQYGLALVWVRQGDYGRALAYGHEATQQWGKRSDGFLRHVEAPALLATLYALRGELETARTWVEAMQPPPFNRTDHALLAQAVMLCRAGRYEEAVRRIQDTAQAHVPKVDVGAVRVIHAFARSRLGQRVPLRPGCVLPERPSQGSYAYLAREWPELAAFLGGEDAPALALGA